MPDVVVNARYTGEGSRPDLPARDLDLAEIELLSPEQRDLLGHLPGMYDLTWGDDGAEAPADQAELASDLEGMRKPALIALALDMGLDDSGTVVEIRARIEAARLAPAGEEGASE